jgi:hypothetical protein
VYVKVETIKQHLKIIKNKVKLAFHSPIEQKFKCKMEGKSWLVANGEERKERKEKF